MPRIPLPDDLPLAFRTADARANGIGEGRLRGSDLRRPFHGVRSRRELRLPDVVTEGELHRARIVRAMSEYAERMTSDEFFSHGSAAILWGAAVPFGATEELHVGVLHPHRLPRARGVRGHQARSTQTRVVVHPDTGLRVASPATTWAMLGAVLRHPYDLVAAGDSFIRVQRMPGPWVREMPPPLASRHQLEQAVRAGRRVGGPALRAALPLLRTGAASRPESWTRLTICDAGLPEPVLDYDAYDKNGLFIGCVDLAYPELKIAIEYEGDHHRTDVATWNRDLAKHDALQAAGWRVIRVSRTMLFAQPTELITRVCAALAQRS
ncbi:conserved hypothetical protein [Microbacterium sp. C448]|uniref:endonuclease domain-containing protein n=1 Tax=Microbacterium TaxID=33882 RepID=UPI0003DE34A1|nr:MULTISPECIES: hypothetical protein [Microbacterium]CDJ99040.1 conserved hypothetical protein [Microbacterium sp. C448]